MNISKREKEVIFHTALEKSSVEIALELDISEHTVYSHIQNLFKKMEVKNRVGLVVKAILLGHINEQDLLSEYFKQPTITPLNSNTLVEQKAS